MVGARIVVAVVLASCAPPAALPAPTGYDPFARYPAEGAKQFGAPTATSEARPWKIGQWVRYKRTGATGVALEQLAFAARDSCGDWLVYSSNQDGVLTSWTFCVYPQSAWGGSELEAAIVIERRNREVVRVDDLRMSSVGHPSYAWLVGLVQTPAPNSTDVPREDVATPAGHFLGAVKQTNVEGASETTRWSHPAVPLGGVVKEVASDHVRVVLEYGMSTNSNMIELAMWDLQLAQKSFGAVNEAGPFWWGMQGGMDAVAAASDVNAAFGFAGGGGLRVTPALDVVVQARVSGAATSPIDAALHEDLFLAGAGVRWFPLGRMRIAPMHRWQQFSWLYTEADLSYAELSRWGTDADQTTVGRGAALGAVVGVVLLQGRDWAGGLELHDHLAVLNADEGVRNTFGLSWFIQLYQRPTRYTLPW